MTIQMPVRPAESRFAWTCVGLALGMVLILVANLLTEVIRGPDTLEEGPIVILSGRDDSIGRQRQQLVDQWNRLHPEVPARIVELPGNADAQRAEMLARAQSGRGEIDIYNLDVTWVGEFAEAGYIRSLDESTVATEGFLAGPLATCYYRGKLWALPFNTDVGLLYYRTDLVDNPPRTWEELRAQVEDVRRRTGGAVDGYLGQFADYEGLTVTALEVIAGADRSVVADTGEIVGFTDRDAVAAGLERLRAIAPARDPQTGAAGVPALDEASAVRALRAGAAVFMRNWPVAYRSLDRPLEGGQRVPFGVAPLPGDVGVLGGQNLAIAADTKRHRAAQALIEFLTSDHSQQILFERGGLPATRAVVYLDEDIRERYPYVATLERALRRATVRPAHPHYARFSEAFRAVVNDVLRGDQPVPEDLEDRFTAARLGKITS